MPRCPSEHEIIKNRGVKIFSPIKVFETSEFVKKYPNVLISVEFFTW